MLLKERTSAIDNLISSIDSNNAEIINEVDDTRYFLEDLDQQLILKKSPPVPGVKINDLMAKWGKEMKNVQTTEKIQYFGSELWLSLAKYEEQIKSEVKGHEYYLRKVKKSYQNRIDFI